MSDDIRDAAAVTGDHLAVVTEETIMDLVEGANFVVDCPECGAEWAMSVGPMTLAGLTNMYGSPAIDARFRRLARDVPAVVCGVCIFRGLTAEREGKS